MADPIVVGVDGSESGLAAVDWAANEATRRDRELRIVHALGRYDLWGFDLATELAKTQVDEPLRESGKILLDEAIARARARVHDLEVSDALATDDPAPVLVAEARHAQMIVVGNRGRSRFAALLVGSVGVQVAAHATCPTILVRDRDEQRHGEVVVGVDGSQLSLAAIAFAFEEASLRDARLRAVHVFAHPVSTGPGDMLPLVYDADELEREESRVLAESVAGHWERFPDVEVVQEVVRGHAVAALADASTRADLVVLGSRGRGGFSGLVLGSVSHGVLHHAACPVAIIRSTT